MNSFTRFLPLMALGLFSFSAVAQTSTAPAIESAPVNGALPSLDYQPRAIIVVAHPDDEYFFAATSYRIVHDLGGTVDQIVITDGRGGFRYSLTAQPIYSENLTDPSVAADKLPKIRRHELKESGKLLGIHKHYFLNRLDKKTLDLNETYAMWGGVSGVQTQIRRHLELGHYDFIFTMIPTETNHGHHKAAGIIALQATNELPADQRPVVLGAFARTDDENTDQTKRVMPDDPIDAREYQVYQPIDAKTKAPTGPVMEITRVIPGVEFKFDRQHKFGFNKNLSYQVIVNWMIAAHKSQGMFQSDMNAHRYEAFRPFTINSDFAVAKAQKLFEVLANPVADASFTIPAPTPDEEE